MKVKTDIAIVGAGLAGMTLALQLKKSIPELKVTIIDQRVGSAPERAFKIGESMVEVSSWYLGEVLELRSYLLENHLPKFGLRFFMNGGSGIDFGLRPEYGLLDVPEVPNDIKEGFPGVHLTTYNVDRGRFENHLVDHCKESGVDVFLNKKVESVKLGNPHQIHLKDNPDMPIIHTRWVIDSSGRSGLLNRQKELREPQDHQVNAVWFRLEGRIDPEGFSNKTEFHERIPPKLRWLSTNHLMGKGYWIWIIPLPDEATSIGIMLDPAQYSFDQVNQYEKALSWLHLHEPCLAKSVADVPRLDFKVMKSQAYLSRQILSVEKWALSGESALFSDALYSPGGDFIAVTNTLITEMIKAETANDRKRLTLFAKFGEQLLKGMYFHYLGLYRGVYELTGRPGAILQKVAWDTAVYFAYNVLLFRNGYFCDPVFHSEIRHENARLEKLQKSMISYLKNYRDNKCYDGKFIDQSLLKHVQSLYLSSEEKLDQEQLKVRLKENIDILEDFASKIEIILP